MCELNDCHVIAPLVVCLLVI